MEEILRRPETGWDDLCEVCDELRDLPIGKLARRQVEIETKYAGYIRRQSSAIDRQKKVESLKIPESFDFRAIPQLRMEARDRLSIVRPVNLGQAGRVSGITPADIAVLMMYLGR